MRKLYKHIGGFKELKRERHRRRKREQAVKLYCNRYAYSRANKYFTLIVKLKKKRNYGGVQAIKSYLKPRKKSTFVCTASIAIN